MNEKKNSAVRSVQTAADTTPPACQECMSRRQFAKTAGRTGIAAFVAAASTYLSGCFGRGKYAEKVIGQVEELPVGGSKIFQYPTADRPCLLIRASADNYVAYSRLCTHVQCPVSYDAQSMEIVCPCHGGIFSVTDGSVLQGPPQHPLPKIVLDRRGDELVATGVVTG
jgi:nitrite reductase/ring-hydroxylating ferredoxin subunit